MSVSNLFKNKSIALSPFDGIKNQTNLRFHLNDLCNLLQIPLFSSSTGEDLSLQCIPVKRGQQIYGIKQDFEHLYIVNSGFAKTIMLDEAGNEQILSFPMRGDLIGTDGIYQKKHALKAVALSNCTVVVLPFNEFMALCKRHPIIETALYSIMSHDLIRKQAMASVLGSQKAEARIARFLTTLSERFSSLGYSGKEFHLSMTRQEIASHLGISLETASRTFAALDRLGFITVEGRLITLNQPQRLKTLRHLPPSKAKTFVCDKEKFGLKLQGTTSYSH